jgi:hypothetical protein
LLTGNSFSWWHAIKQIAGKWADTAILSPFAVILSETKNLALPLRVNCAKDLALRVFMNYARFFVACGSSE